MTFPAGSKKSDRKFTKTFCVMILQAKLMSGISLVA